MPSAVIRRYEYDPSHCELRVTFQSGKRYIYRGVPATTYTAMRNAFSKGEFFNAHIRDLFPFTREDSRHTLPMKQTRLPANPKQPSEPEAIDVEASSPVPGTAPIKTPNPADPDPSPQPDEVPRVGSQDAPGG